MRKLKFVLAFAVTCILASCLDSEEKITINADNTGMYSMTIDMGKMLEMAAGMGAKSGEGKAKEKKDTVVYMKDFLGDPSLTPEEKALYAEGKFSMHLDEEKNEMKIVVSCPFKNQEGLTAVKNNLMAVIKKVKAFEKASGEAPKEESEEESKMAMKSTNPVGDQFTFLASKGKISNTIIDLAAYKEKIANDSSLAMMNQVKGMMGDFKYRTILVLPSIVKKYEGPGSVVSADKKTVTFETTLTEMMEQPEKVGYKIEY